MPNFTVLLIKGILLQGKQQLDEAIQSYQRAIHFRPSLAWTPACNAENGSCIKCTVVGEWDSKGRHMSYPKIHCPQRTDESFHSKADEDHHKEHTPLTELPINMIEDFVVADSLHLFHLVAYVNLGTALIAAGRCQEAVTVLRQGARLDGTGLKDRREHESAKVSALLQLGALYSDQGRLQRALAAYREAAHNLPEHYPPQKVYNVLGETLAKMHQDEEAEKWYRAALDAQPDHVPAHITYGRLLAKNVSRSAEAEQWFRKAQRLAPQDASVYHHYGAFLASSRRYKEAATMYEKAAELRSDDYELAVAAATSMRKAGRQDDAERWYRRAVRMKPKDARGHTNLGAILHLNGKYKEAEESYREALRLQPDDATTLTNLQKLYGLMT